MNSNKVVSVLLLSILFVLFFETNNCDYICKNDKFKFNCKDDNITEYSSCGVSVEKPLKDCKCGWTAFICKSKQNDRYKCKPEYINTLARYYDCTLTSEKTNCDCPSA